MVSGKLGLRLISLLKGFLGGSDGKESACKAGDLGLIPGLGRSPGGEHGNPLQYSGLESSMDRGAWWTTLMGSQRIRHDWVTKQLFTFSVKMESQRVSDKKSVTMGEPHKPFFAPPQSPQGAGAIIIADAVLTAHHGFSASTHLILAQWGRPGAHPHFMDGKTEAQRGSSTHLKPHS